MAFVLSDRIKETTTTTSTGTYTLGGAVSGFETFTANLSNGDTTYYCCTDGTDFEVGLGTFASSGTTLARTTIISSSNSNNAVNWSSGSRDIFCTLPGSKAVFKDGDGHASFADNEKAKFGDAGDLEISHDGSNSIIEDVGTGGLRLKTGNAGRIQFQNAEGDTLARFNGNGNNELYHNNSKKFETSSTGATLTGKLTADTIDSGDIRIEETSPVLLYNDTNASTDNKAFQLSGNDGVLTIQYLNDSLGGGGGYIQFPRTDNNLDSFDMYRAGVLKNRLTTTGDNYITSGNVGIGTTSPSAPLDVSGDAEITGTLTAGEVSATTLDIGGTNITATATEINKLDGVTATTTELNYVDVTTLGTVEASKAVTADANGDVLFPDNEKAFFGTGSDLYITHTGSASQIVNQTVGDLQITNGANDKDVDIRSDDGSGSSALYFKADGSSGNVRLYHYGTEKFKTTSDGAQVTGDLTVTSTDAGASEGPLLILDRNSSSPANSDEIGEMIFRGRDSGGASTDYANIASVIADITDPQEDAYLRLRARVGGANILHVQLGFSTTDIFGRLRLNGNNHFADPSIIFEGQTANANETELKVVDPSQDNTITLPDATGTVLTTGNSDTPTTTTSSSDADFVLVDDGGTMKKITPSNLGITSGGASKGFAVAMAIAL